MVEHSAVNRGVVGSSPTRGAMWPVGQAVKTPPFHGGIRGSIPLRVTKRPRGVAVNMPPCHGGERGFESHRGRHLLSNRLSPD